MSTMKSVSTGEPGKITVNELEPPVAGAAIWLNLRGVQHLVVVDILPERLERALSVGADARADHHDRGDTPSSTRPARTSRRG